MSCSKILQETLVRQNDFFVLKSQNGLQFALNENEILV